VKENNAKRKQAYYFSHDANARRDPKIQAMMIVYGGRGYAWFWILLEMMREQANYSLRISGKHDLDVLAKEMSCKKSEAKKFISFYFSRPVRAVTLQITGQPITKLSVPRSGEIKIHRKSKLGRDILDALLQRKEISFSAG
jgi:predicted PilT family ATPase